MNITHLCQILLGTEKLFIVDTCDILGDRTADILAQWLKEHPGIEIVSRDRSQTYADAITAGAPEAIQVADRFHLLQNLSEAVVKILQVTSVGDIVAVFGIIPLDGGFSPYSSRYIFTNQWFAQIDDQSYLVFASSLRSNLELGGKELERPWPSVIVLEVRNDKGERLSKESGEYRLPEHHGMLRILDAGKDGLLLVTEDGQGFSFDLGTRTFYPTHEAFTKTVSQGVIKETGIVPYPSENYDFINYWSGENDGATVYGLGGCMKDDLFQGVVVKIIVDQENNRIESTVYLTPVQDGCVRIVDMAQDNLILVTMNGVALAFNPNTKAPAYTPLPTYNPYP